MRHAVAALILCTACGGSDSCPPATGPVCEEAGLTIQQGVYGLAREIDDVKDGRCTPPMPVAGSRLDVRSTVQDILVASSQTDSNGIYQIELATGDYELCSGNCIPITVTSGVRIRVDLDLPFAMLYAVTPPPC